METKARLVSVERVDGKSLFTLEADAGYPAVELERMKEQELRVKVVRYRQPRPTNANALFWFCVEQIANALCIDKQAVYIDMLRQFGKFTHACVKPSAKEDFKKQWSASEEVGPIEIKGQPAIQLRCYYGSSTYNAEDMSKLIDGTVRMMQELELEPPMPTDVKAALKEWETYNKR